LQFEIVAILGLLALFTHIHLFWVAALLLALIDIPDFGTPLRSIAGSVEKIANNPPEGEGEAGQEAGPGQIVGHDSAPAVERTEPVKKWERGNV
jgi:hypothetical protein